MGTHAGDPKQDKPFEPKPPAREQGDAAMKGGGSSGK
jgi:hypothetical protein